jgi:hypothetical protein
VVLDGTVHPYLDAAEALALVTDALDQERDD